MPREIIRTTDAPKAPPAYSQAVRVAGLVFVSGIGPYDPVSGAVAAEADVTLAMVLLLSPAGSRPVLSRGPPVARQRSPSRHLASQIIYAIAIAIILSN